MDDKLDGKSSIEWIDRETLRYYEDGYSVLVWMDYEPGFFNNGRIIRLSSLENWDAVPGKEPLLIDAKEREVIINNIKEYHMSQSIKCRVD